MKGRLRRGILELNERLETIRTTVIYALGMLLFVDSLGGSQDSCIRTDFGLLAPQP